MQEEKKWPIVLRDKKMKKAKKHEVEIITKGFLFCVDYWARMTFAIPDDLCNPPFRAFPAVTFAY